MIFCFFLVDCLGGWNQWMWLVSCRRQEMLPQGPAADPKSKLNISSFLTCPNLFQILSRLLLIFCMDDLEYTTTSIMFCFVFICIVIKIDHLYLLSISHSHTSNAFVFVWIRYNFIKCLQSFIAITT